MNKVLLMGLLKASLTGMTGNLSTLSFLFLYGKLYCEKELTLNDGVLYPARIPIKICSSPFLRVICQFSDDLMHNFRDRVVLF